MTAPPADSAATTGAQQGMAADELPEVDVSTLPTSPLSQDDREARDFDHKGRELDLSLRRWSARGALLIAALGYLGGFVAAARFSLIFPEWGEEVSWHVVVATLAALFTVPTVLVLSVFRGTHQGKKQLEADPMHSAIASKVMDVIDKVVDKFTK